MKPNGKTVILIAMQVLFAMLTAVILAACRAGEDNDTLGDDISVNGLDISGMTVASAREALSAHYEEILKNTKYTVVAAGKEHEYTALQLGFMYDAEDALTQATSLSRENPANNSVRELFAVFTLNEEKAQESVQKMASVVGVRHSDADFEYGNGEFIYREGTPGYVLDEKAMLAKLKEAVTIETQVIEAPMLPSGESGITVEQLKQSHTLLAEFCTYFNKEPYNAENRVKNVVKAAGLADGVVIGANEEFDTNKVLGDRNKENGWSKAPGIRDGKYEMEYGGGVCQVSTTLYNAALIAGLEITERRPHSWPVGYVPIGMDATISTGGPNLVFVNNTESNITVSAIIDMESFSLTVRIFGQPGAEHGSRVEIVSEQTGTIPIPEAEYLTDNSLSEGESVTDRRPREGKTSVTYRVTYNAQGNEIRREVVSQDTYKAIAARIYTGA